MSDNDRPETDMPNDDYDKHDTIVSNVDKLLVSSIVQQSNFAKQKEKLDNIYNGTAVSCLVCSKRWKRHRQEVSAGTFP